ncbi:MAG: ankyrin repeat domain-containing protein [Flavobacteriaceae bacterium]
MGKTILTCAVVLFTMVSGLLAASETATTPATLATESKAILGFELNSFCMAIVQGDYEAVKKMIELGEDINQKSLGKTPAIYAARYNQVEILKLLIANGADLKRKCDKGWTIQEHAEHSNAKEALAVIRENI